MAQHAASVESDPSESSSPLVRNHSALALIYRNALA
jgi:hypothetical protein